ncbi:hypothetical protein ABZ795_26905, partial [Micromonospora sp. NPDC047134]
MNTMLRKSVLALAGLTVAGGLAAGPLNYGTADTTEPTPTTATTATAAQAEKPDTTELIPHGVQGNQSRIDLDDEQVANTKAIIAATK